MPRVARIVLTGRHVHLEPLALEHAEPLVRAANVSRATFTLTVVPDSIESMRAYIETLLAEEERGETLPFVVRDAKNDGAIVGATRFMSIGWWKWGMHPPPAPIPVGPDVLEIGGTWYAEKVQRTAVNTEAKLLLCGHAFETLHVRRVLWKTDARNTRSRTAIARLGAKFDGVLRAERAGSDGVVRDSAYYSMLASEWPDAKVGLRARLG